MKTWAVLAIFLTINTEAVAGEDVVAPSRNALKSSDDARAIQLATTALNAPKVSPDDARQLHAVRGQAYLEEKSYQSAVDDLTAAIGVDETPADVCSSVGEVFLMRGTAKNKLFKYRDAIDDMKFATDCAPTTAEVWVGLGNAYFGVLDGQNAIAAYTHALQIDPNDVEALRQRGKNYENAHMFDQAIADYGAVLKLDPSDARTYNNRATLYSAFGKMDEAISDYTKSIAIDPTSFMTFFNRGSDYFYQKKYDLSRADLEKAKSLYSSPGYQSKFQAEAGEVFARRMEYQMAQLQFLLDNLPKQ